VRQMVGDNGEVDRTASDCERCLDWHRRPLCSRDCILSKQQQYSLITCEIKSDIKETISNKQILTTRLGDRSVSVAGPCL